MKLSSQELEQFNYSVFFKEKGTPEVGSTRHVVDPIEVDIDNGTVTMTVIQKVSYTTGQPLDVPLIETVTKKGEVWIINKSKEVVYHGKTLD